MLIIADDEDDGGEGETVINVVDAHKLVEITLSKKDAMNMCKTLLKKTVAHLNANGKEDRVDGFKKGATEFIKFVMDKFDEMQIFQGESLEEGSNLCFAYTKDGETEPTFMFFHDALKEEKF